jgi:hypothetical protein
MPVRGAMQGAGGDRATRSYPQHCLGATDIDAITRNFGVSKYLWNYLSLKVTPQCIDHWGVFFEGPEISKLFNAIGLFRQWVEVITHFIF